MTWVRLDPGMFDNPKVTQLSDRAYRAYVQAILWSVRQGTDGEVTRGAWPVIVGQRTWSHIVRELVSAGLVHEVPNSCSSCADLRRTTLVRDSNYGSWVIHELLKFNPSTTQVQAKRDRDQRYKKRRSAAPTKPDGGTPIPTSPSDAPNSSDKAEGTQARARLVKASKYLTDTDRHARGSTETDTRAEFAPDSPMEALISAVRSVRPFWSPFDITEAAQQCAAQGRPYTDTLAAFLRIADDPRITWPSRVVADGPWWRPVTTPALESKSDARFRRTMERAEILDRAERLAIERRNGMHVLESDGDQE